MKDKEMISPCHKEKITHINCSKILYWVVWNHFFKFRYSLSKIILPFMSSGILKQYNVPLLLLDEKKRERSVQIKFLGFGVKQIHAGSQLCTWNWQITNMSPVPSSLNQDNNILHLTEAWELTSIVYKH